MVLRLFQGEDGRLRPLFSYLLLFAWVSGKDGSPMVLETCRQQRKEREAFVGHCYNKFLSPVPFCLVPERGTTHSLRI